ncbi:MAG: hypothetical protein R3E66_06100 [bacterium]
MFGFAESGNQRLPAQEPEDISQEPEDLDRTSISQEPEDISQEPEDLDRTSISQEPEDIDRKTSRTGRPRRGVSLGRVRVPR